MESEKLIAIKNDLVENITYATQAAFQEYIRDEDSYEAYYSLQIELSKMYAFMGLLERHFFDLDLKNIYNQIKQNLLKEAEEYCNDCGYELTEEHLECLDGWLS